MKPKDRLQNARLLLVTDPRLELAARVQAAVRGGVDIVQLRDKRTPREELLPLAMELKEICERAGALFTVND
nr:thiamine phosphate synthase [Actinomycetota bacterium]